MFSKYQKSTKYSLIQVNKSTTLVCFRHNKNNCNSMHHIYTCSTRSKENLRKPVKTKEQNRNNKFFFQHCYGLAFLSSSSCGSYRITFRHGIFRFSQNYSRVRKYQNIFYVPFFQLPKNGKSYINKFRKKLNAARTLSK